MAAEENFKVADVDKAALRMVFPRLLHELQGKDIIDELYERSLLKTEEYEGILDASSKDDPKSINRRVLMAVSRRPPGFVSVLVEILWKKYSSLANALERGECSCLLAPQRTWRFSLPHAVFPTCSSSHPVAFAEVSSPLKTGPAPPQLPGEDRLPLSSVEV